MFRTASEKSALAYIHPTQIASILLLTHKRYKQNVWLLAVESRTYAQSYLKLVSCMYQHPKVDVLSET